MTFMTNATWRLIVLGFLDDLNYLCVGDGAEVNIQVVSFLDIWSVYNWCAIQQAVEVLLPFIGLF